MSQHSELEPCPYCGGNASLSKIGRDWYRIAADHVTGCPLEDFQLDCPQSDDQLPLLLHDWNTRVDRTPSNNAEKCDQLRAEVAGLRTGYEAYEQVNAELKAEVEGLRKEREGKVLVPVIPSDGLLMSMAVRSDHALGCPGYYDQKGLGRPNNGVSHARMLECALADMRKLHEEVVGTGFYSAEKEAEYLAMAKAVQP